MSIPLSTFEEAYSNRSAPWVIGEPQPVVVALEQKGLVDGKVLDVGCGTGENALHLAARGHDVTGHDFSPHAIEKARENARAQGAEVRFEVADALALEPAARFDTVVDSALFHLLDPDDRSRYAERLHGACRSGAVVHVLGLSDVEPGFGPVINDSAFPDAFGDGWSIEDVRPSRYRGMIDGEQSDRLMLPEGTAADMVAVLARVRRQ